MNEYLIKISVNNYNPFKRKWKLQEFEGTFVGKDQKEAISDAKEFYAHEMGTVEEEINIILVKEV